MSNSTQIIDKVFGLIDKAFSLLKVMAKVFILLLVVSVIFSMYYLTTLNDKPEPKTCDTMAQQAQEAMKNRQEGVSLRDALKGVTDKDQSKIIVIVYDTPVYKDKAHKAYAIETAYISTLAECVKAK
jgi:hypothetical protein